MRGARARAHAQTPVAEILKQSRWLILNDTQLILAFRLHFEFGLAG